MKSNKPQHHDDCIHALHEEIPQGFADDLLEVMLWHTDEVRAVPA